MKETFEEWQARSELEHKAFISAKRKESLEYARLLASKGAVTLKHGTYHTYNKYKCRCEPCKLAASEYRKRSK